MHAEQKIAQLSGYIKKLDIEIKQELQKNSQHIRTLETYRGIIEKKDFDFMNMSDQERLNAKIMKQRGL